MKREKITTGIIAVLLTLALCACASSGGGGGGSSGGGGGGRPGEGGVWTFDNPDFETEGWYLANSEFYQYHGSAKLSREDTAFGGGMLRLDVDYTQDKDSEWSEVKMANDFPKSINMKGIDKFAFDFYYNPSLRSEGMFKPKIWSNNGSKFINETGIDIEGGDAVGDGWYKAKVEIYIMPGAGFIPDMRLSIAGYLTDYVGPVYFDNIAWVAK
jgi:mannan endo-1,4-beta-mannosidase